MDYYASLTKHQEIFDNEDFSEINQRVNEIVTDMMLGIKLTQKERTVHYGEIVIHVLNTSRALAHYKGERVDYELP